MIVPERDPHFIYTPECLVSCSTKIIFSSLTKTAPVCGFLLPIVAKPGKESAVPELVLSCVKSLAKSSSIQLCYGLKYVGPAFPKVPVKEGTTSTCAIVGICKSKVDVETSLQGML